MHPEEEKVVPRLVPSEQRTSFFFMECRKHRLSERPDSLSSRAKRGAAANLGGQPFGEVSRDLGVPKQ